MRRIVLRSTPSTRSISRWDLPASSRVWTEIRKFGFKTFTPRPFFRRKRAQRNVPPPLSSSAPTGVDLRHQVEEFDPPTGGGSWVPAGALTPHVVEKDYVLGWMLAGIYSHDDLAANWVFKGGTCLKKCFFETYRFSEDLDFTLTKPEHLDADFLKIAFSEIGEWIYEQSGIEIPADKQEFEIYRNPRGQISCQGKISYKGHVSSTHGLPRVKLDLIADERIVLPPVRVPIFHPYTDVPDEGIEVLAYDYVEAFAEKFRALAERTRPRDLYDVVHLYRNAEARPDPRRFMDVLRGKCEFKGIGVPRLSDLEPHRADLETGWIHMLEHQLPALLC